GPYKVKEIPPQGTMATETLDGQSLPLVNGSRLKLYAPAFHKEEAQDKVTQNLSR
ncbi:hypothetical protein L7F22_015156, partial [Adiantum nelumboides]|nr:hypothetical protein [Adiantum nelumboides]